jgi:hypothetical protein
MKRALVAAAILFAAQGRTTHWGRPAQSESKQSIRPSPSLSRPSVQFVSCGVQTLGCPEQV